MGKLIQTETPAYHLTFGITDRGEVICRRCLPEDAAIPEPGRTVKYHYQEKIHKWVKTETLDDGRVKDEWETYTIPRYTEIFHIEEISRRSVAREFRSYCFFDSGKTAICSWCGCAFFKGNLEVDSVLCWTEYHLVKIF